MSIVARRGETQMHKNGRPDILDLPDNGFACDELSTVARSLAARGRSQIMTRRPLRPTRIAGMLTFSSCSADTYLTVAAWLIRRSNSVARMAAALLAAPTCLSIRKQLKRWRV